MKLMNYYARTGKNWNDKNYAIFKYWIYTYITFQYFKKYCQATIEKMSTEILYT